MKVNNLFVTSTVGQVRNAAALIESKSLANAMVLMLYTRRNIGVLEEMVNTIKPHMIGFETLQLPGGPNSGDPRTVKKISKLYRVLIERTEPNVLWLANLNSHYAMLAKLSNAQVNYFEEGLGSYKPLAQNEIFPHMEAGQTPDVKQFIQPVLKKFAKSSYVGRAVWGLKEIVLGVKTEFRAYRDLAAYTASQWQSYKIAKDGRGSLFQRYFSQDEQCYYEVWQGCEEAHVVFPERLDPEIFSASTLHKMGWTFNPDLAEELTNVLSDHIVDGAEDATIYVSQNYGGNSAAFYNYIADCIAKNTRGDIFVKFHPKESEIQRDLLIGALRLRGVGAIYDECLNGFPAEVFFETGRFKKVLGICSTALIYGAEFFPSIRFDTIGSDLVGALEGDTLLPNAVREKIFSDIALFEEFMGSDGSSDLP